MGHIATPARTGCVEHLGDAGGLSQSHDPPAPDAPGATRFSRRLLSAAVLVAVVALLGLLSNLLIVVFAGVVLSIALRALADVLVRWLHVPPRWSVLCAVVLIAAVLTAVIWLVGDPLLGQLTKLRERLPAATQAVTGWLHAHPAGRQLLELWHNAAQENMSWGRVLGVAGLTVAALGNVALILVLAIYLAADPALYRNGVVRLLPVPYRARFDAALSRSAAGLRGWLLGQSVSMALVGSSTAVGLWALGIPLPLAVGLISGLLAFIPFFGAIAGGLLAVLTAFIEGPQAALHVALLCVAIQQIENHVLMPLVQRWAVQLPPVLTILASVVFGLLFGVVGVLFATPLMVVAVILVRELYVEGFLEQATSERP